MFGLFETYFESEAKLDRLVLPSSCVSFYFVFLCFFIYYFFFLRFKFKGNHEKRSDHGSQNRAVEPQFERLLACLALTGS